MPYQPGTRGLSRRTKIALVAGAVVLVIAIIAVAVFWFFGRHRPIVLPFTGINDAYGVAVDGAGDIYVTDDGNNQVLELPKGASSQVVLPFTGLNKPFGVAVDGAGNVYVADSYNSRVLKLAKGSTSQVVLPLTGLSNPIGVAVDGAGNLYVSDFATKQVLKLPAGSPKQVVLPFTGLHSPGGVAVDPAGNVYVVDRVDPASATNGRLLKLPAGSTAQTQVSAPAAAQWTQCPSQPVAVDTAGSVYILCGDYRVYQQATGSNSWTVLPFTDLGDDPGLAVDTADNLYITRGIHVLKLPAH
jgi:serine/threonine-protein kinase